MSEETNTAVLDAPVASEDRGAKIRAGKAAAKERRLAAELRHARNKAKLVGNIAERAQERAAFAEATIEAITSTTETPGQRAESSGAVPEDFGIVQVGIEGIHEPLSMSLGKFSPPDGFDRERFSIHWAARKAGTLDAWKSVAESQQPQKIEGTSLTFPGWRVYHKPDGSEHTIAYGTGELVMMYTLRQHWDVINKATAQISKNRGQAVKAKIQASELLLPSEVRQREDREDEQYKAELLALQRLAETTS